MDGLQPVEVMLRGIEEIQLFLLSNPDKNRKLSNALVISYALIKLTNTCLYAKALERWYGQAIHDQRQWRAFRSFFVQEYEYMLHEGGDPSTQEEGHGSAFHAMGMDDEDGESIVESIVQFLEKASVAEANMI